MRILPAILTSSSDELLHELELLSEFTDEIDLDIMDGVFVSGKSFSLKDIPVKEGITFNFDLMVQKPLDTIKEILEVAISKKFTVGRIFVHIESEFELKDLIDSTKNKATLGFSISVPTGVENFLDICKKMQAMSLPVPPVQIMTIEVGRQGNPYHPEVLAKIQKIKQSGYTGEIYVDGGVDPDVVMNLRQYGIAGVSVGSYISHSSDPLRAFSNLRDATWKKDLD